MEDKETKRKQLLFRSGYRGINEMDKLLHGFATAHLAALDASLLLQYEQLLEAPDPESYEWLTGQVQPPAAIQEIVSLIRKNIAS